MTVANLPLLAMLKTRMHWHQTRQKLLAENVANADTPGFRPNDLREPAVRPRGRGGRGPARGRSHEPGHMTATSGRAGEASRRRW